MARRLTVGLVLWSGTVLLAACAEPAPPTLADGSLEAAVPGAVWPDDPSLVSGVDCPALDPALVAQSTTCTAMVGAAGVTLDVVIDDLGAAVIEVRESLYAADDAADGLAERLRTDLGISAVQASCRPAVVLAEPGTTLDCTATHDGRPIEVVLELDAADPTDPSAWILRPRG